MVARDAAALCVTGESGGALGRPRCRGAGRGGAWRHPRCFCVAGVALGDINLRFALQGWHLQHWAGFGGALGRRWSPDQSSFCVACVAGVALTPGLGLVARHLRGRRGTWCSFCMAGVALSVLDFLIHNFFKTFSHNSFTLVQNSFTTFTTFSHTTLSHTTLSHTIFLTKLCHTQLFHIHSHTN